MTEEAVDCCCSRQWCEAWLRKVLSWPGNVGWVVHVLGLVFGLGLCSSEGTGLKDVAHGYM